MRLRAGQTDKVPFTPPGATEQAALEACVEANSVSPHRFKALIGRGHSEFGSPHQQDACEFFIYLMQLLERSERVAGARLPAADGGAVPLSSLFKFSMEQRTQCATTGAVSYKHLEQNVLHVDIPLEAASNGQARSARSLPKQCPYATPDVGGPPAALRASRWHVTHVLHAGGGRVQSARAEPERDEGTRRLGLHQRGATPAACGEPCSLLRCGQLRSCAP